MTTFLEVKDNATSKLAVGIDDVQTTLTVKAGEGVLFPASNFVITVDTEKMLCSSRTVDALTVTRGYDSTVCSTHAADADVNLNVIAKHITDITTAVNTLEGDVSTAQGDITDVAGDLSSHTGDSAVHWKDHDHSATGAQGGSLSTSSMVIGEVPGGLVNGANMDYTTASAYTSGSLRVTKNGIRLKGGGNDYTEVANGFTMVTAPAAGAVLLVDYNTVPSVFATGSTSFIYSELCGVTPNGVVTAFTTASSYVSLSTVVFLDGVRMRRGVDYTESADKQIAFTSAPLTGSEILIDYQSAVSVSGNADTLDGQHGLYYGKQSDIDIYQSAKVATVATTETTASTSYADLATTTDTVTVAIGPKGLALVNISSGMVSGAAGYLNFVSFAVSGANTIAASDANGISQVTPVSSSYGVLIGKSVLLTGLTAGSTTFKMKYRCNGSTSSFSNRQISVIPL